ncbi:hypothetical protein [Herminiimonas sp. KBW02]|uniref:hypothetical protein n=1 Tax=Herminiimonas sp. KBW02 TaxID=2153363 RepID=UPI000F5AAB90|nr:hypothetical protein [Herminiimonas sp. KBW02]
MKARAGDVTGTLQQQLETMTTEAKKIRQAYEEGKAFRQPEIDQLKAEIVELKRQLSEQQQKEPA